MTRAPESAPGATVPLAGVLGVAAAAALVPLNSTMIAVALPSIGDDFGVSTADVSLLVTLYLVVMLIGQPLAGRVADAVGSRLTVRVALLGLAAFSALAVFAGSFPVLVATRAAQAVCAAALGPSVQSLLREMSPPDERGRVFGILGSAIGVGAASGPVLGGVLVLAFDWRGIFVVNVPIALLAIATTRASAHEIAPETAPLVEHVTAARIANPVFLAGYSTQSLTTQAQYALLLLTPILLDARGWGAGSIGLVLSALTVGMIVSGPLGGRLGDRSGYRLPATAGIALAALMTGVLAVAGRSVHPALLTVGLALFGVGLGAATPNLMSAALGSVPEGRTGAAAGILTTSRYVGSIVTTILIAALVTDEAAGVGTVLTVSVACMAGALVVARWLPGRVDAPLESATAVAG